MPYAEKEALRRTAEKSAGALYHTAHLSDRERKREMAGLVGEKAQEGSQKKFLEKSHSENAYGQISLGANQRGEVGLVVSGKQEYHGRLAKGDEKELDFNSSKRRSVNVHGEVRTNKEDGRESALGLFSKKTATENQMMGRLLEHERIRGNDQLEKQLPFLDLERDREEKQRVAALRQAAKDQGQGAQVSVLEAEGRELAAQISLKEQLERSFRQELRDQLEELREHPRKTEEELLRPFWKARTAIAAEEEKEGEEGGADETEDADADGINVQDRVEE